MSQQELLKHVVHVLAGGGIQYMLTGSLVSSYQGEPRSTHDIDLVVQLPPSAVGLLMVSFQPPDYYLSRAAIDDAIRERSMFNLLSVTSGEKVDFWMMTDEPFDRSRFARRRVERILGLDLYISTPEDTILAKLRWAKMSGGSEKQFTDALRVYEVQADALDLDYLNHWASELAIVELWTQIQADARPA
jgi:hypothetical protein